MSTTPRKRVTRIPVARDGETMEPPVVQPEPSPKPSPFARIARRADVPPGVEVAVKYVDRWWATDEYPIGARLAAELAGQATTGATA